MKKRVAKIILLSVLIAQSPFAQTLSQPTLRVTVLEHAALFVWDSTAQSSTVFTGYRLYRGQVANGVFTKLREWKRNAEGFIPNQFYDIGDDNADGTVAVNERLKNSVEYYYRVSAFADSSVIPPRPFMERFSAIVSCIPNPVARGFSNGSITLTGESGAGGDLGKPKFAVTNIGNFDRLHAGHRLTVSVSTISTGTTYLFPVTVTDNTLPGATKFFMDFSLSSIGDTVSPGIRQGTYLKDNLFDFGALALSFDWRFEQLRKPIALDSAFVAVRNNDSTDTPVIFRDTIPAPYVGLLSRSRTFGEMEYEIEFLPGGIDTVNFAAKRLFRYMNVKITEQKSGRMLEPGGIAGSQDVPAIGKWTISRFTFDAMSGANVDNRRAANRYYLPTTVDSSTSYIFSNSFYIEGTRFVCDYANQGRGIGRPWPRVGRKGTRDFSVGDKIKTVITGGVKGVLPFDAVFSFDVGQPSRIPVTLSILNEIRIVPNPYLVRHAAQRLPSERKLLFQYLPDECTIRIYSLGLEIVKTIHHRSGGTEQWDLLNEKGNLVASQLFLAHIESPNGISITRKFAVVTGE